MTQKEKARRFDLLVIHLKWNFAYWCDRYAEQIALAEDPDRKYAHLEEARQYAMRAHEHWNALGRTGLSDGLICPCSYCESNRVQAAAKEAAVCAEIGGQS